MMDKLFNANNGLKILLVAIAIYVMIRYFSTFIKEGMSTNAVQDSENQIDTTSTSTVDTTSTNTVDTTSTNTVDTTSPNYDNYNHYSGDSTPSTFYGPDGGIANVLTVDNNHTLVITNTDGSTDIYYINNSEDINANNTFTGNNGGIAKMITSDCGNKSVEITGSDGSKIVYSAQNTSVYNSQDSTINQYSPDTTITGTNYDTAHVNTISVPTVSAANTISGPNNSTANTYDSTAYYDSLGISKKQIPAGDEDLYILKSQVIPPVCPKCPEAVVNCPYSNTDIDTDNHANNNTSQQKCPACPACARCPEPAFECKKVPNYSSYNKDFMPVPVLADFSTFGM